MLDLRETIRPSADFRSLMKNTEYKRPPDGYESLL